MGKIDNKKKDAHEFEINLIPLLKELLKKLWLIVLVGLIVGGSVFIATKIMIKPSYRSGFTAYVNNKQGKQDNDLLTSSDVSASKQIVQTYQKILTSNTILTAAAESMGIDVPYSVLKSKVSTEVQDETEIISVYVVDTDPQFAYDYAQAISKIAPQYMAEIVEGSSMKIIDHPEYSDKRFKPSYIKYALFGFIIGAVLVVILLIIRFFMDDTVKNEEDVESMFSIPILGVIPDISRASNSRSDYYYYAQNSNETKPEGEPENEKKE